jgi:hypothetical protein
LSNAVIAEKGTVLHRSLILLQKALKHSNKKNSLQLAHFAPRRFLASFAIHYQQKT